MAKQTALQVVNKVLQNLGESSSYTVLTSLSGLALLTFNTMNEVLYELEQDEHWKPLETNVSLTLGSNTATYTRPTNLSDFDRKSFRYKTTSTITWYTPQRVDRERINTTYTAGAPEKVWEWMNFLQFYPVPGTAVHGSTVTYRGWINPTVYDTATPTGTGWVPEGYDLTTFADLVTYKVLHYTNNPEASVYYAKVYGDPQNKDGGSLARMKARWRSPEILDGDNIMVAVI